MDMYKVMKQILKNLSDVKLQFSATSNIYLLVINCFKNQKKLIFKQIKWHNGELKNIIRGYTFFLLF